MMNWIFNRVRPRASHLMALCGLLTASALAGCAPVDQAALVYASRVQVGIQVASGTVQEPGAELSLGYKQHDAAFVPVMAGRHCEKGVTCTEAFYPMRLITGTNSVTDQSSDSAPLQMAQAELTAARTAFDVANKKRLDADNALVTSKAALLQLTNQKTAEDATGSGDSAAISDNVADDGTMDGSATDDVDEAGAAQADIQAAEEQVDKASKAIASLADVEKKAKNDFQAAADRFAEEQKVDRKLEDGDRKVDALSVYGSFDGNADVRGAQADPGMNVKLGKIFSTGIAAQNLTQGLGRAACLQAGVALLGADDAAGAAAISASRLATAQSVATYCLAVAKQNP